MFLRACNGVFFPDESSAPTLLKLALFLWKPVNEKLFLVSEGGRDPLFIGAEVCHLIENSLPLLPLAVLVSTLSMRWIGMARFSSKGRGI